MKTIILSGDLPHNCQISLEMPVKSGQTASMESTTLEKDINTESYGNVHGKLVRKNNGDETVIFDSKNNVDEQDAITVGSDDTMIITLKNDNTTSTERGHKMRINITGDGLDETVCKLHFSPVKR